MAPERRRHERVRIRAEVRVRDDGAEARYVAHDLSLGGTLLAETPGSFRLEPGRRVILALLPDEDGPHHAGETGTTVRATARVIWRRGENLGVAFEDVDVEARARLLALVAPSGE